MVDDAITRNTDINSQEYSAYIALLITLGNKPTSTMLVNCHTLCYALDNSLPISRKTLSVMNTSIAGLMDKTTLDITLTSHKSVYLIDSMKFHTFSGYASKVPIESVYTIMNSAYKGKKSLLKYYILLLSLLAGKKEDCILAAKWTIRELSNRSGLCSQTVIEYNKLLVELELIYFFDKYLFDNEGKCQSTIFAKWKHKHHVQRYVNRYFPYGVISSKSTTNEKRAYALMYRWLCKGKQYDNDTVALIKEYVTTRNQQIKTRLDNPDVLEEEKQELVKQLLDETIFDRL